MKKKKHYSGYHRNTKDPKRLLGTITYKLDNLKEMDKRLETGHYRTLRKTQAEHSST